MVKRPFCEELIYRASEFFEVVMFTASVPEYAEPLYQRIDRHQVTAACLYRDHCTFHNGLYVKDLAKLGRPLSDIVIVDNSPLSSLFQPENAVPVTSWYEDKNDRELFHVMPVLERLAGVVDVRTVIPAIKEEDKLMIERAREVLGIPEPSARPPSTTRRIPIVKQNIENRPVE